MEQTKNAEILSARYDEEMGGIVTILLKDEKIELIVQLSGGQHQTQQGCWLLAEDENGDIDLDEYREGALADLKNEIVEAAEKSYSEYVQEKMQEDVEWDEEFEDYKEPHFSKKTSAVSYATLRVQKSNKNRFRVFWDISNAVPMNEYSSNPDFAIQYFDTEKELEDFLNSDYEIDNFG